MTAGLRAVNRLAASPLVDRLGIRDPAERFLHSASRTTVRIASRASRTFAAAQRLAHPVRQTRIGPSDLFDLSPTDEQQMLRDAVREFALGDLRPAAQAADAASAAAPELLAQAGELGRDATGSPRAARRARSPSAPR